MFDLAEFKKDMKGQESTDLGGLMKALEEDPKNKEKIQRELNKLKVEVAKKFKAALEYLMREMKEVQYIGLKSFVAEYKGTTTARQGNGIVEYTSKHFHATAKIFSITPLGIKYDIGFIQICSSRTQKQTYTDEKLNTRWEIPGKFPMSDSAGNNSFPWYFVGSGVSCLYDTARKKSELKGSNTFELDDNFIGIKTPIKIKYKKNDNNNDTTLLTKIERKQNFQAWFAVKRSGSTPSTYRLMKEMKYGFDFVIEHNQPQPKVTSKEIKIEHTVPMENTHLPDAAKKGPMMNAGDKLNAYKDNTLKCAFPNSTKTIIPL